MVYRTELTYDEIVGLLVVKYSAGSPNGTTFTPVIYKITDNNWMSKSLLLNEVKVKITVDDIRLRSNLTNKKKVC